ncbi:LysR substrate-binding domain-containing protein [Myxococcota bacterium]|nr:LysR substrate-binding domain-containing protein [Myxococcota bacterium]
MLDSLRHLLLIEALGSFTAAAKAAHLTQPALTASIQRLEEAVGARLLHRHARGATLTAAGEALLPHARAALAAVEAARRAVAEVEGLARGRVRIGGGSTACTYLLPPVLTAFHQAHPGVDLRLREMLTPDIAAAVEQGELDLGIATSPTPGEPWRRDPMALVASPALAASLPLPLAPGAPALTFSPGSSLRALLDRHLPELAVVVELSSIAAIKGHARAGMGVALLSRVAVETDLALGRLVEVADPRVPPPRQLVLVHPGEERLSPAARALRTALLGQPPASVQQRKPVE